MKGTRRVLELKMASMNHPSYSYSSLKRTLMSTCGGGQNAFRGTRLCMTSVFGSVRLDVLDGILGFFCNTSLPRSENFLSFHF